MVTKARRQAVEHLYDMKQKFGITNEQYAKLYDKPSCWVCGSKFSIVVGRKTRLVIDHDHDKTGPRSIRGILCHWCNMAIGFAEDNPKMLRRMADYLENYVATGGPLNEEELQG